MSTKDLTVRLRGDASELNRVLDRAGNDVSRVGRKLTKTLTPAAAGIGLAFGKMGADWNNASDAIIVGTGATGDALAALEGSAKRVGGRVSQDLGQVGEAIAEVNTRLGLTGPELEEVSKRFLDLAKLTGGDVKGSVATVTRVFGDWSVEAQDQARVMDVLFAATQQTGIGMDRLSQLVVQFGAPMRQLGFSLEESIALFGKWEREGVNIETVMAGMRQGLGRMAKAGEEPIETFQRIVDAIKNATTQMEANNIAADAFGTKAGPDMAAAIREGRFEISELVAALGNSEGSIDTAVDGTTRLSERLAMLRNRITGALGPFGELGGAIGGAVASLGPLLFGIGQVTPALGRMATSLRGVRISLAAVGGAVGIASVALAGYAIHQQRIAERNREMIEGFEKLSSVADEQLGRVFTEAVLAAMLAGKNLDEAMQELADTNLAGARRAAEYGRELGLSEEAQQALDRAIRNTEEATKTRIETEERFGDALGDTSDALGEATAAAWENEDALRRTGDTGRHAYEIIDAEIERAKSNIHRFGADGVEQMAAIRDAAAETAGVLDQMIGRWSEEQSVNALAKQWDRVLTAQADYWTAEKNNSGEAAERQRDYRDELTRMAIDVFRFAEQVGGIPTERLTRLGVAIDSNDMGEIERAIDEIFRDRNIRLDVNTPGPLRFRRTDDGRFEPVESGSAASVTRPTSGGNTYIYSINPTPAQTNDNVRELTFTGGNRPR